jgi:hypothetical protein
MDINSATAIIYAFNTIFKVILDSEKALVGGLKMMREINTIESIIAPSSIFETISTILNCAVEFKTLEYVIEIDQMLLLAEKRLDENYVGREFGRYLISKVIYQKHIDAITGREMASKPLISALDKLKIDDGHNFKTPTKIPRKKSPKPTPKGVRIKSELATPNVKVSKKLVVPTSIRLPNKKEKKVVKTETLKIFEDKTHAPLPAPKFEETPKIKSRTKTRVKKETDPEWTPGAAKGVKGNFYEY